MKFIKALAQYTAMFVGITVAGIASGQALAFLNERVGTSAAILVVAYFVLALIFIPAVMKEDRDYPACSRNPHDCPENEGRGCCGRYP